MPKKKDKGPLFVIHPDGRVTSDHWLLTIPEAATAMGVSAGYLRRQVLPSSKDRFPIEPIRVGKRVRFRLLDIIEYIKKTTQ
jgi:predicted DNA-binding transcriptional regulator AlpA